MSTKTAAVNLSCRREDHDEALGRECDCPCCSDRRYALAAEDRLERIEGELEELCRRYCEFYDKGISGMDASAMTYEMVSRARITLAIATGKDGE